MPSWILKSTSSTRAANLGQAREPALVPTRDCIRPVKPGLLRYPFDPKSVTIAVAGWVEFFKHNPLINLTHLNLLTGPNRPAKVAQPSQPNSLNAGPVTLAKFLKNFSLNLASGNQTQDLTRHTL